MNYKLKDFQIKQNNQLTTQWVAFYSSNKHEKKIDWSKRQRGEAKARVAFVVSQAINQKWNTLPTNKAIAEFAGCKIRWVKKIINSFLGIRKWLSKMKSNVRIIETLPIDKQIHVTEVTIKSIFGYVNPHKQIWKYIE